MSEFRYMKTEVVVKRRDDDDALRIWCDSFFAEGLRETAAAEQKQRILDELVRRDLVFNCSHGRLHTVVYPVVVSTTDSVEGATMGGVQVEAIDLSF